MQVEEIRIPAPWGHIAVKIWGDAGNQAVLLGHGLLDNAGTYDRLIQRLPKSFYYICIDFPGHGFSSYFPIGTPIITIDYILVYKIVADFFKRNSYIVIGHSLGGQLAITFTQMYPEYVKKLIILDAVSYRFNLSSVFLDNIQRAMDIVLQPKNDRSKFTKQQALKFLMENRTFGVLTIEAAEPLMARMFDQVGDDTFISRADSRLKGILHPSYDDDAYFMEVHKRLPIKCKVLVILLERAAFHKKFPAIVQHFKDRHFEVHLLKGHHDYHNTNPEVIAPIVSEFLTRDSKL